MGRFEYRKAWRPGDPFLRTRIAFLARASTRDGLGHLMRSICVMRAASARVDARLFLVGDCSGSHLVEEAHVPWQFCESDTQAACEIRKFDPHVIVLDMLDLDEQAFTFLKKTGVTVSLSPVFTHLSSVDHLFHRTSHEDPRWRQYVAFPEVHKGLGYTILPNWLRRVSKSQFCEQLHEKRLSVAISMGGSDAPNRTLALIERMGRCVIPMVLWVALGDAYTHSYEKLLKSAAQNRQEIILIKSNDSMWRVLKNTAIMICAGGLTTYEAAYMGIPTINLIQSEEWGFLFTELEESGVCVKIPPGNASLDLAIEKLTCLAGDRELLMKMHTSTKRLVPSGGANQVAKELIQIAACSSRIRRKTKPC